MHTFACVIAWQNKPSLPNIAYYGLRRSLVVRVYESPIISSSV